MTALPLVEIYAAKWRLVVGVVVGLWLAPVGTLLMVSCSGAWDVQFLGLILTTLGVTMIAHYLKRLARRRPGIVITDRFIGHDRWSWGQLPLVCVRNVWLTVRPEEGLSLNFEVDAAAELPRLPGGYVQDQTGPQKPLSIHLGGLSIPMGVEALREDIAYRAVAARMQLSLSGEVRKCA